MKCMKGLKKSILCIFLSVFLVCCFVCMPCFNLSVYASPSLLDRFVDFVFPSREEPWYAKDVRYVQNMIDPPFKGEIQWFDETSGSHGGGGHSRNEPIVKDTNPSIPSSMLKVNYSNQETYLDCFNPEFNTYETINNFYTDNSQTYICETENYFISYEFNETYYTICVAPVQSPTDGKFFNVYYQLPDGRNSFNLTPDDIRGVVFNYSVVNYDRTVLDSSVLGLYRLDGNYSNFAINHSSSYFGYNNLNFIDGRFGGGISFVDSRPATFAYGSTVPDSWTLEFWCFVPYQGTILQSDIYSQENVCGYDDLPSLLTENAWNYVVITSDFQCWINGVLSPEFPFIFYSPNSNNPQVGMFNLASDYSFNLHPVSVVDSNGVALTKNIGGTVYTCKVGVGWAFDEILFRSGTNHYSTNFTVRSEPFDLPFAYTVPDLPVIYEREEIEFSSFDNSLGTTWSESLIFVPSEFLYYSTSSVRFISVQFNTVLNSYYGSYSKWNFNFPSSSVPTSGFYKFKYRAYYFDSSNFQGKKCIRFACGFESLDGSYVSPVTHYVLIDNVEVVDNLQYYLVKFPNSGFYFYDNVAYISKSVIGVQSPFDVHNLQVGGIRPLYPSDGDVYVSFFRGVVSSVIQYYEGVWHDINASVFYRGQWINVKEFDFTNLMLISDSSELSNSGGATYIINENSTYNYYGVSGNDLITVSGNEPLNVVVDTNDTDVSKLNDFIKGIPKIFGFVIALLTLIFPFLPVWLSGLFSVCFIVLFTAFIIAVIKR